MNLNGLFQELYELMGALVNDTITSAQHQRLQTLLRIHQEARAFYHDYIDMDCDLHQWYEEQAISNDLVSQPPVEFAPAEAPATHPERVIEIKTYAERQLQKYLEEQEQLRLASQSRPRRSLASYINLSTMAARVTSVLTWTYRSTVIGALASAAVLVIVFSIGKYQANRVVARVDDTFHAQWSIPPETNELSPGWRELEKGFVRLLFAHQAEVLIEAPCAFKLCSPDRMILEYGTLTARVPPPAQGFTVDTPNYRVVDFGTEFGVQVGNDQSATIHVFEGGVELRGVSKASSGKTHALTQGQGATVDTQGQVALKPIDDSSRLFTRTLPTGVVDPPQLRVLDLADMVGGGNGLGTGSVYVGLDLGTGAVCPVNIRRVIQSQCISGFKEVSAYPMVDGVFVPDVNEEQGPIISTSQHRFLSCPDTSGGYSQFHHIFPEARFKRLEQAEYENSSLHGQDYGSQRSSLGMHANAGITFDLDQIRQAHPEYRIARFRALCGLSETLARFTDGTVKSHRITAGFWVLVDGELRFHKTLAAIPFEAATITIDLEEEARFLSLATTDNGFSYSLVWSLFAEPRLELEPIATSAKEPNKP